MPNTRDIKRRIRSISSTKKVTRAMEMVAATKMRKAIEAVLKTRPYANLSWTTVLNLSKAIGSHYEDVHPLLVKRKEIKKVAVILITSNRGLCGAYNSAIINQAHQFIKRLAIQTNFILIGRRGQAIYKYFNYNIIADFPKADLIEEVSEIIPVSQMIIKDYLVGNYDKILLAYTDFISTTKQIPRVKQLLPIDITSQEEYLGIVGQNSRLGLDKKFIEEKEKQHLSDGKFKLEYTFEPSPAEVLDEMLPRLIEVQLYQAILEANASEHSARMNAMHQATEAAGDMVNELTLFFNKARQASITREIAEISAGANALR